MLVRALRWPALLALLWAAWWAAMHRELAGEATVRYALHHHLDWLVLAAQAGGVDVDEPTWPRLPPLWVAIADEDPAAMRLVLRAGAKPHFDAQDEYARSRQLLLSSCGAPCRRVLADYGFGE